MFSTGSIAADTDVSAGAAVCVRDDDDDAFPLVLGDVRARCDAGGTVGADAGARSAFTAVAPCFGETGRATGAGRTGAGAGSATNGVGSMVAAGVAMLFSVSVTALAAGSE